MTSGHLIFIPAVLAFGFLLGFLFSRKWAEDQVHRALKREKEREEMRKKRAARKKKKKSDDVPEEKAGASSTT